MQADIAQRLSGLHQTNEALKDYQQMLDDTNDRIGGLANTVKGYELRGFQAGKISRTAKVADQLSLDAQEKASTGEFAERAGEKPRGISKSVKRS